MAFAAGHSCWKRVPGCPKPVTETARVLLASWASDIKLGWQLCKIAAFIPLKSRNITLRQKIGSQCLVYYLPSRNGGLRRLSSIFRTASCSSAQRAWICCGSKQSGTAGCSDPKVQLLQTLTKKKSQENYHFITTKPGAAFIFLRQFLQHPILTAKILLSVETEQTAKRACVINVHEKREVPPACRRHEKFSDTYMRARLQS